MTSDSNPSTNTSTLVKTACKMCYLDCGIDVYLQDGRVTKVEGMREHPSNEGRLCPKGRAIIDYVYGSDRLKYPLKRVGGKGEEKWARVTWDDALGEIASKLSEIKERYGAKSLAAYTGQGYGHYETKWFLQRFCDAYGTPNFAAVSSMCWCSPAHADLITYGSLLIPDVERSNCIIVLGANPTASDPVQATRIAKAKRRGAKVIVVDPRRTPSAANADIHLQLKPGTDAALGLAMLNVIISERLYDERFVDKWTTGFAQLEERVKQYSPEAMEKVTWVPTETIRQAAFMYAQNKPASIYKGNATAQQVNGFQGYRAFMLLPALTGGVDVAGGCVIPMKIPLNNLRLPTTFEDRPIGAREHPLYVDQWREAQALLFSDAILTGKPYPIEAMIVAGANPALLWANSSKTRQALEALKFLVVIDTVMSETAKLADLVLPAGSFLERTELRDYGQTSVTDGVPYVMLRKKAISLWECRPDAEIVFAIARKMGYDEQFPWNTGEEAIDYILQPSGISVRQLTENPSGFTTYEMKYGKYERDGFRTPSKKIELYSKTLEKYGYDPLPSHREAEVDQDTLTKYPLTLTSGGRILEYVHSQHRNIPKLRKRVPEPWVEIHPETARSHGIIQGDSVEVETEIGHITVKARITDAILPNLIHVPHAWREADVNSLITDEVRDPVTGFPAMKSTPCQIRRSPAHS